MSAIHKSNSNISGVIVKSTPDIPFVVGQNASLTCSNAGGNSQLIEWRRDDGIVLASTPLLNELEIFFTPVNDSRLIHGREFICVVTRNGSSFSQSIFGSVLGTFSYSYLWFILIFMELINLRQIIIFCPICICINHELIYRIV